MDEYNINNIEKINAINFININNNDKLSSHTQEPLYNNIQYLKSFNRINNYQLKKNKSLYKKSNTNNNDLLLQDKYLEEQMKDNNLIQKYNNRDISYDFDDNRENISNIKINSKKYEGLQKKKTQPILSYINMNNNQNIMTPIENVRYNNNYNNNPKFKIKAINPNNLSNIIKYRTKNNQFNINNNNPLHHTNKTLYSNDTNNNKNPKLNYFTDYSIDDNTTSQSSKVNIYIKKINEYKKMNQDLMKKLNLYSNNLKSKNNEIQDLKQLNQTLENELYLLKEKNEQNNNEMKMKNINNNEELKKVLMQKNKMIKEIHLKMQKMKKELENYIQKNTNLSKILAKKNMELVNHQKELIEKDKTIEELNLLLNQKQINEDENNENLNLINMKIKTENEEKENKIEIQKKINELEID